MRKAAAGVLLALFIALTAASAGAQETTTTTTTAPTTVVPAPRTIYKATDYPMPSGGLTDSFFAATLRGAWTPTAMLTEWVGMVVEWTNSGAAGSFVAPLSAKLADALHRNLLGSLKVGHLLIFAGASRLAFLPLVRKRRPDMLKLWMQHLVLLGISAIGIFYYPQWADLSTQVVEAGTKLTWSAASLGQGGIEEATTSAMVDAPWEAIVFSRNGMSRGPLRPECRLAVEKAMTSKGLSDIVSKAAGKVGEIAGSGVPIIGGIAGDLAGSVVERATRDQLVNDIPEELKKAGCTNEAAAWNDDLALKASVAAAHFLLYSLWLGLFLLVCSLGLTVVLVSAYIIGAFVPIACLVALMWPSMLKRMGSWAADVAGTFVGITFGAVAVLIVITASFTISAPLPLPLRWALAWVTGISMYWGYRKVRKDSTIRARAATVKALKVPASKDPIRTPMAIAGYRKGLVKREKAQLKAKATHAKAGVRAVPTKPGVRHVVAATRKAAPRFAAGAKLGATATAGAPLAAVAAVKLAPKAPGLVARKLRRQSEAVKATPQVQPLLAAKAAVSQAPKVARGKAHRVGVKLGVIGDAPTSRARRIETIDTALKAAEPVKVIYVESDIERTWGGSHELADREAWERMVEVRAAKLLREQWSEAPPSDADIDPTVPFDRRVVIHRAMDRAWERRAVRRGKDAAALRAKHPVKLPTKKPTRR